MSFGKAPEDPFVSEIRRQARRAEKGGGSTFWRGLANVGAVGWMVSLPAVVGALVGAGSICGLPREYSGPCLSWSEGCCSVVRPRGVTLKGSSRNELACRLGDRHRHGAGMF